MHAHSDMNAEPLTRLLAHVQEPARFAHRVDNFELLETHISYVLLTGTYAYKFKKPIDLGFLNFTTLEQRRFYCYEELRLNKRLAPALYEAVVAITGSVDDPHINGTGPVLEYAVKMRQFPAADRLDRVCERGELSTEHIDQLADDLATFHRNTPATNFASIHGTTATISARVMQNFEQIAKHCATPEIMLRLGPLKRWSHTKHIELHEDLTLRQREGWIRECHGDLHLANCALVDGRVLMFDALEFADDLRWIDPLSEIAFLIMDLVQRGQAGLAQRFLNRYLENTNDYQSLNLLPYYLVYRAMVRAKVAAIEAYQQHKDRQSYAQSVARVLDYLELAISYSITPPPAPLILMHGLSGSGKSQLARGLIELLGGICLRSDVQRKRLLGLPDENPSRSSIKAGAYTAEITEKTYQRLRAMAYPVLDAGLPVFIDATFLRHEQRAPFQRLAQVAGAPFIILSVQAPDAMLRSRILERNQNAQDASEATLDVLAHQLTISEPLTDKELERTLCIDTAAQIDMDSLCAQIKTLAAPEKQDA